MNKEPDFSRPLDILAFMQEELGLCGCADYDATLSTLKRLLSWVGAENRSEYQVFIPEGGMFYLLMGNLDRAELINHGVSIRHPFLTERGEKFLHALETTPVEYIENASGEAYDGLWYGA